METPSEHESCGQINSQESQSKFPSLGQQLSRKILDPSLQELREEQQRCVELDFEELRELAEKNQSADVGRIIKPFGNQILQNRASAVPRRAWGVRQRNGKPTGIEKKCEPDVKDEPKQQPNCTLEWAASQDNKIQAEQYRERIQKAQANIDAMLKNQSLQQHLLSGDEQQINQFIKRLAKRKPAILENIGGEQKSHSIPIQHSVSQIRSPNQSQEIRGGSPYLLVDSGGEIKEADQSKEYQPNQACPQLDLLFDIERELFSREFQQNGNYRDLQERTDRNMRLLYLLQKADKKCDNSQEAPRHSMYLVPLTPPPNSSQNQSNSPEQKFYPLQGSSPVQYERKPQPSLYHNYNEGNKRIELQSFYKVDNGNKPVKVEANNNYPMSAFSRKPPWVEEAEMEANFFANHIEQSQEFLLPTLQDHHESLYPNKSNAFRQTLKKVVSPSQQQQGNDGKIGHGLLSLLPIANQNHTTENNNHANSNKQVLYQELLALTAKKRGCSGQKKTTQDTEYLNRENSTQCQKMAYIQSHYRVVQQNLAKAPMSVLQEVSNNTYEQLLSSPQRKMLKGIDKQKGSSKLSVQLANKQQMKNEVPNQILVEEGCPGFEDFKLDHFLGQDGSMAHRAAGHSSGSIRNEGLGLVYEGRHKQQTNVRDLRRTRNAPDNQMANAVKEDCILDIDEEADNAEIVTENFCEKYALPKQTRTSKFRNIALLEESSKQREYQGSRKQLSD
ncbi:hypothetical protein FGO68_gene17450 [Halteria grandinella]|uniref:Uncharacterized protein n=1 Tax=Halteria grandinella TaxID=5974 RepID=A0A8J8T5X2_HALGN|nr:hypothetical protein FGO68_gene17450 [Halteria grandinella]